MNNRAAIYLRPSPHPTTPGPSVDEQRARCMKLLERNNLSLHREYTDRAYSHPEYDTARPGFKQMVAAHLRGEFSHIIAFDLSYLTCEPTQACVLYEQAEEYHPLTIITTNGDIDITNGGSMPFSIQISMARYNMSIAHEAVGNNPDRSLTHRLDITPDEFSPEYDHIGSCIYRCALCATTFRTNNVYYKCPQCDFRFGQNLVDHTVTSMIADVCDRKFIFDGVQYAPDNTYMRKQIAKIEKANAVLSRIYRDIDKGIFTEEDMQESIQRHNDTITAATSALNTNLSHSTILNVPDDIPDKRTFFDADPQTQREIINTLATIRITTTNNPKISRDYFKSKYVTFDWKVTQ